MATWVGLLTLDIQVPGAVSLKEKRQVVRSVTRQVHNTFNVAIAEVDDRDQWQSAVLAVSCVGADKRYLQGLMSRVVAFVDGGRFDLVLVDYTTELL